MTTGRINQVTILNLSASFRTNKEPRETFQIRKVRVVVERGVTCSSYAPQPPRNTLSICCNGSLSIIQLPPLSSPSNSPLQNLIKNPESSIKNCNICYSRGGYLPLVTALSRILVWVYPQMSLGNTSQMANNPQTPSAPASQSLQVLRHPTN